MAVAAILNFTKSRILSNSNLRMANICPHTKFDANIFIGDRDMSKQIQDGGRRHLEFYKKWHRPYCVCNIYQCTKFDQISSLTTKIWPKIHI